MPDAAPDAHPPLRQIRASYTERTIRVYQAYSHAIADRALEAGTFVAPFKRTRMTWIKPSFRWMLYRCGWATKDPGQARVLGIDITRDGFEWALAHSCLSHGRSREELASFPVRVQWDPERDLRFEPLDHRSIQVGLSGEALDRYVEQWIEGIEDLTEVAVTIGNRVRAGDLGAAAARLPDERIYPVPPAIAETLGMSGAP